MSDKERLEEIVECDYENSNKEHTCEECSTSFFKGYKPRGYFNTTNN